MLEWTTEKMEWYVRASRFDGFHRRLTDIIRPALKKTDTVVDIGSGPGMMSLEISRYVNDVKAIDCNEYALGWLDEKIREEGYSNIQTAIGDYIEAPDALLPGDFDVALFCYFGGPGSIFESAYRKAKRLIVMIMHGTCPPEAKSKNEDESHRVYGDEMEEYLVNMGIPYKKLSGLIRFGQPLISKDEAKLFVESYAENSDEDPNEHEAYIKSQLALVEKLDDPIFPWYLPKMRDPVILFIEKD